MKYNYKLRHNVPEIAWNFCYYDDTWELKEKDEWYYDLFKKYEHIWKSNANHAFLYAVNILKKRWPPGEKIILTNAKIAMNYAIEIIKGRWPEAEESIAEVDCALRYYNLALTKNWNQKKLLQFILENSDKFVDQTND